MSEAAAVIRRILLHFADTAAAISPALYLVMAAMVAVAAFSEDFYLMEVLILLIIYAQFAASWDVLSGYTDQDNFGHAFFIGGAAYLAALLNKGFHLSPWLSVPAAASMAAIVGIGIGCLTLRLRGPYFALSTIAFAAVLFKLAYIFSRFTGGEEGLTGIDPFTQTVNTDLYATLALFYVSLLCLLAFARSHYGLVLRSTRHNEDAAQASGLNTAYYKIAGFAVSGFFAGIGGGLYAHTHMQVNPELLAGSLSIFIVLLATVGGRGTIIGPVFAAGALMGLNEWLRVVETYRVVLFTGLLILLAYLNPSGIANGRLVERAPPLLRRFLLGRAQ